MPSVEFYKELVKKLYEDQKEWNADYEHPMNFYSDDEFRFIVQSTFPFFGNGEIQCIDRSKRMIYIEELIKAKNHAMLLKLSEDYIYVLCNELNFYDEFNDIRSFLFSEARLLLSYILNQSLSIKKSSLFEARIVHDRQLLNLQFYRIFKSNLFKRTFDDIMQSEKINYWDANISSIIIKYICYE